MGSEEQTILERGHHDGQGCEAVLGVPHAVLNPHVSPKSGSRKGEWEDAEDFFRFSILYTPGWR